MVQRSERFRIHRARVRGADVFVHISAVERAGLRGLADGQKVSYEIVVDSRNGKSSADQLSRHQRLRSKAVPTHKFRVGA